MEETTKKKAKRWRETTKKESRGEKEFNRKSEAESDTMSMEVNRFRTGIDSSDLSKCGSFSICEQDHVALSRFRDASFDDPPVHDGVFGGNETVTREIEGGGN